MRYMEAIFVTHMALHNLWIEKAFLSPLRYEDEQARPSQIVRIDTRFGEEAATS